MTVSVSVSWSQAEGNGAVGCSLESTSQLSAALNMVASCRIETLHVSRKQFYNLNTPFRLLYLVIQSVVCCAACCTDTKYIIDMAEKIH